MSADLTDPKGRVYSGDENGNSTYTASLVFFAG
jgi:hypothetical protein